MAKIEKLWFDANRIYLLTDAGETLSRPLEAFTVLKEASESERLDFKIGRFGDDIRWEKLDEDVHLSSFYDVVESFETKKRRRDDLMMFVSPVLYDLGLRKPTNTLPRQKLYSQQIYIDYQLLAS